MPNRHGLAMQLFTKIAKVPLPHLRKREHESVVCHGQMTRTFKDTHILSVLKM